MKMYQKLLPEPRRIHHKLAIIWAMLIFWSSFADGRPSENDSELTLKGYSSKSNGGEERNTSSCLFSYSNMDSRELSKCKR